MVRHRAKITKGAHRVDVLCCKLHGAAAEHACVWPGVAEARSDATLPALLPAGVSVPRGERRTSQAPDAAATRGRRAHHTTLHSTHPLPSLHAPAALPRPASHQRALRQELRLRDAYSVAYSVAYSMAYSMAYSP